jgi:hypothetical protein
MLRRSISSSVADLTSGKATHRIARQARQGLAMSGRTADRSYEPFGPLPGGSLASPRDDDYLRELAFHEAGHGRVDVQRLDAHPACATGDVGADHIHGAPGVKRQQSTCHQSTRCDRNAFHSGRECEVPPPSRVSGSDTDNPFLLRMSGNYRNVRSWHLRDMPNLAMNVGFRG